MARHSLRRRSAVGALAVAGCASLIAAAVPAGATAAHTPAYYAGATSGDVLGLTLKLPTALPDLPNPLQVGLIHVDGSAVHDPQHLAGHVTAAAESTASLASGSLVDSLQKTLHVNLNRVAHVELGKGASSQSTSLVDIPAKPLADLSVGSLAASLNKATDATSSSANGVSATLGTFGDLLGTATVNQVSNTLQPVVSQIQNTVNQVLGQLNQVPGTDGATSSVSSTVNAILDKVQSLVANLGSTPLATVDVHDSSQQIAPSGNGVQAVSKLGLVSVNLLGGLLKVSGFSSGATAFANGVKGGARTSSFATKPIVEVNAADALCAQLSTDGINLCKSSALPASIRTQVNSLLSKLSGELTQVESTLLHGAITVGEVPGTSHTSADGTQASVTAPSYDVGVGSIVNLAFGSGVHAEAAAAQAHPVTHVPAQPAPKTPVELPHTGANLGLIGLAALSLLGVAALIRRRLLRTSTD